VFPDVQSGSGVEKVDAVEDGADAAGCGFYFYGSGCNECCG
jgi:hypothetical protein